MTTEEKVRPGLSPRLRGGWVGVSNHTNKSEMKLM